MWIVVLTERELLVVNLCISVVDLIRLVRLMDNIHIFMVVWVRQYVMVLSRLSNFVNLMLNRLVGSNWVLVLYMIVRGVMIDWVLHDLGELMVIMDNWVVHYLFMSMHMVVDWLFLNNCDFVLNISIPVTCGML